MITLADLRARDVLPTWQEAVAIVQELVDVTGAATNESTGMPSIDRIGLSADGAVMRLPGSSVAEHPVRHLAVILELLLDGVPAPQELKELVGRNVSDSPELPTVAAFSEAVAFFERPGRRADIQGLVERASAAAELTRADEELRRLQAKALEAADRSAPGQDVDPRSLRRRPRLALVGAVIAALVVLTAAGVWYALARASDRSGISAAAVDSAPINPTVESAAKAKSSPQSADQSKASQPASLLSRLSDAVRTAASSLASSVARPAEPLPTPAAPPTAAAGRPRSRGQRMPAANRPVPSEEAVLPVLIVTELGGHPVEVPAPAAALDTTFGIYTSTDKDVQAPVMVRPVLPTAPPDDVPPNQLGTLELLVNERGEVEHVRLVSPFNRHQERMIVSNAKTWKFTPASRDGRPVKYRARVRLTI